MHETLTGDITGLSHYRRRQSSQIKAFTMILLYFFHYTLPSTQLTSSPSERKRIYYLILAEYIYIFFCRMFRSTVPISMVKVC